jgi:hypothetical protein
MKILITSDFNELYILFIPFEEIQGLSKSSFREILLYGDIKRKCDDVTLN